MSDTTTIRVTRSTRDALTHLATQRGETMADTVAHAARLMEQEMMSHDLAAPLRDDEQAWLDADAG
ncbi:hypothetical protein [Microbacterium sp.]|uniref:hypothetical protein n=1 Tax=Microbacterium sp. TaxID=51671 RepID=UPI003A8D89E8